MTAQMNTGELFEKLKASVIQGNIDLDDEGLDGDMEGEPGTEELVRAAIESKLPAEDIIAVLTQGMNSVGELFQDGDYMLPDLLASAECISGAMAYLDPYLLESGGKKRNEGTFIIATVEGDLHEIGKNIVITLLKGAGYDVKDLGKDVPANEIVAAAEKYQADFVGLSALLTTTMSKMKSVIELLEERGLREKVKVLVGGAPITQKFADSIGADLYCSNAFETLEKLANLNYS